MSAQGMRGSMRGGMLGALGILVFVMIVGIDAFQKTKRDPGPPSTYNAASGGAKALYLWLRELGLPVNRWERPLTELKADARVLLMISPALGPEPRELKALEYWIRRGGTMILLSSRAKGFAKPFGFDLTGGVRNGKSENGTLFFQPGPYIRGERRILSKTHPGLDSGRPETVIHAQDRFGSLIAAVEQGKGRVVMMTDPSLFTNRSLGKGDHARLALDVLLTHLGNGLIVIDEYHHGYGRATSVASYVFQSKAFAPVLQAGFLLLLVWAAAGRRFGPPRPQRRKAERSSMESIEAMAGLYRRVEARGLALKSVLKWFDEEAARLLLDKDPGLEREKAEAASRIPGPLTDQDLVAAVQTLYRALARARKDAL